MQNIRLNIMFDGTNYYGMQIQKNKPTIVGELKKAIKSLFNEDIELNYLGRTDKGVSAEIMVANFFVDTKIKPENISFALNQFLPKDIKIISSSLVDEKFNARKSVKSKTYCYSLYESKTELPIYPYETMIKSNLNYKNMKKAIKYFKGTKDFTSFVTPSCEIENKVRTIYKVKIIKEKINNINHYKFYFRGNGFLYNQVRIMVGTLVMVGLNKIKPKDIKKILLAKNRGLAGAVMKPQGLKLVDVKY